MDKNETEFINWIIFFDLDSMLTNCHPRKKTAIPKPNSKDSTKYKKLKKEIWLGVIFMEGEVGQIIGPETKAAISTRNVIRKKFNNSFVFFHSKISLTASKTL